MGGWFLKHRAFKQGSGVWVLEEVKRKTFTRETGVRVQGVPLRGAWVLTQTTIFFLIFTSHRRTVTFCRLNSTAMAAEKTTVT